MGSGFLIDRHTVINIEDVHFDFFIVKLIYKKVDNLRYFYYL